MKREMVSLIVPLIFSCCGKDKGNDKDPDYNVCKYLDWYTARQQVTAGVSCWEGNLLMLNKEAWSPATTKCTGDNVLDKQNYYFEKYKTDKCPKTDVIASCKAGNSTLFIYEQEEIEFNPTIFSNYCRERLQGDLNET